MTYPIGPNSLTPIFPLNHDALDDKYFKVVEQLVRQYNFSDARQEAGKIMDANKRKEAFALIDWTVNNFSTIEETFPFG